MERQFAAKSLHETSANLKHFRHAVGWVEHLTKTRFNCGLLFVTFMISNYFFSGRIKHYCLTPKEK